MDLDRIDCAVHNVHAEMKHLIDCSRCQIEMVTATLKVFAFR